MSELVLKSKLRWILEGKLPGGDLKPVFVRVNTRPTLSIEEKEIAPETWTPGKCKWGPIDVTIFEKTEEFWSVANLSVYQNDAETPKLGTFKLTLFDEIGIILEGFELEDAYIKNVEFEEWNHSCTNPDAFKMEIHYEKVKYKSSVDYSKYKSTIPGIE